MNTEKKIEPFIKAAWFDADGEKEAFLKELKRLNLPVSNLALELSKNQSQLKAEASTDNAPATKNITAMNISAQPQVIIHQEISW